MMPSPAPELTCTRLVRTLFSRPHGTCAAAHGAPPRPPGRQPRPRWLSPASPGGRPAAAKANRLPDPTPPRWVAAVVSHQPSAGKWDGSQSARPDRVPRTKEPRGLPRAVRWSPIGCLIRKTARLAERPCGHRQKRVTKNRTACGAAVRSPLMGCHRSHTPCGHHQSRIKRPHGLRSDRAVTVKSVLRKTARPAERPCGRH